MGLGCKNECPCCKAPVDEPRRVDSRVVSERSAAAGTAVEITGLRSRADLNGVPAKVVRWVESKGRYQVSVTDGAAEGTVLLVRAENLLRAVVGSQEVVREDAQVDDIGQEDGEEEGAEQGDEEDVEDEDEALAAAIAMSLADINA